MTSLTIALWIEMLKARRSKVLWLAAAGFTLAPLIGALFMVILKDPAQARELGLLNTKAQLTAGEASWPAYFTMLLQAIAVGGGFVFAVMTSWIFGREFADRTMKELLAVPVRREAIVVAKLVVIAGWVGAMAVSNVIVALLLGSGIGLPDWSLALLGQAGGDMLLSAGLTLILMTPIAFLASAGRGYLPPIGFALLTLALGQISVAIGWGDWFPWAVPALFSGLAGPRSEQIGAHSYLLVLLTGVAGLGLTLYWWTRADQTK